MKQAEALYFIVIAFQMGLRVCSANINDITLLSNCYSFSPNAGKGNGSQKCFEHSRMGPI